MAPAGNYESFLGAVAAGADAVYLAGTKYGARAYADNFTEEEILMAVSYAHVFGRKVYLTVNTLLKDEELRELPVYLEPYAAAGLDGVIVQDLGALLVIREHFPRLALHVSTQMSLTGEAGAELLKELGAVRIVPARELSLEEIRRIKEKTGLEIETFIHGAMCYSYSGQQPDRRTQRQPGTVRPALQAAVSDGKRRRMLSFEHEGYVHRFRAARADRSGY